MNVFQVLYFFLYDFKVPRESWTSHRKANFSAVRSRPSIWWGLKYCSSRMYPEVCVRAEVCVSTCDVFLIPYIIPSFNNTIVSDTPPRSAHKCTATCLPTTVRALSLANKRITIEFWFGSSIISFTIYTCLVNCFVLGGNMKSPDWCTDGLMHVEVSWV